MAIGLNTGVYDTTKITPPPAPNYSLSAFDGATPTMVLDTAGTWDGHQVEGVLFEHSEGLSTYHPLSSVTLSDGLLGSASTEIRSALADGTVFYLITTDRYGIPFTVGGGDAVQTPLSGQNIVVGPNRRRLYHLGYI